MVRRVDGIESQSKTRRGVWRRRILTGAVGVIVVLGVLIWQLPTLAAGMVSGRIVGTISDPDLVVTLDRVKLRWSGVQQIEGLHIRRLDGSLKADLNLSITASLLALAGGDYDLGESTLSGTVALTDSALANSSGADSTPPTTNARNPKPQPTWPPGLKTQFKVISLGLTYTSGTEKIEIGNFTGQVSIDDSPGIEFSFKADTRAGDKNGTIKVGGTLNGFVRSDSVIDPQSATFDARIEARNFPVAVADALASFDGLLVSSAGDYADADLTITGTLPDTFDSKVRIASSSTNGEVTASIQDGRLEAGVSPGAIFTIHPELLARLGIDTAPAGVLIVDPVVLQIDRADLRADVDQGTLKPSLDAATIDLKSRIGRIVVERVSDEAQKYRIDGAELTLSSKDVTSNVTIGFTADVARSEDVTGSPLDVQATIENAFDASGKFTTESMLMRGSVKGSKLPADLLDALAGLDGWLLDAAGTTIDEITLKAQPMDTRPDSMQFTVAATSAALSASARGIWGDGMITLDGPGSAVATWKPGSSVNKRIIQLLGDNSPITSIASLGEVELDVSHLRFSLERGEDESPGKIELNAAVSAVDTALDIQVASVDDGRQPITINGLVQQLGMQISTVDLDQQADVQWNARFTTTAPSGNASEPVREDIALKGTATIENARDSALRRGSLIIEPFAAPTPLIMTIAGSQGPVIGELLGEQPMIDLEGSFNGDAFNVSGSVKGSRSNLRILMGSDGDMTTYEVSGSQRITPRALEFVTASPEGESGIELQSDVLVNISASTTQMNGESDLGATSFHASLDRAELLPMTEGGAAPVIEAFSFEGAWPNGLNANATLNALGTIKTESGQVGRLDAKLTTAGGLSAENWSGLVELAGLSVARVERVLDLAPGALSQWVGAGGSITVNAKPAGGEALLDQITIGATFDRARFALPLKITEDRIELRSPGTLSVKADGALIMRSLNDAEQTQSSEDDRWRIPDDPEINANLTRLVVPWTQGEGAAIDHSLIECEALFTVSPWSLVSRDEQIDVGEATGRIEGPNLGEGLTALWSMTAGSNKSVARGSVDVEAVYGVGAISRQAELRSLDATVVQFPVSIVDALGSMNGQLTAALGSTMNGTLHATDADLPGGGIEAHLTTDNGRLDWTGGVLRNGVIEVIKDRPMTASLNVTQVMSETVMASVHPLLYDIRKKSGPIALNIHTLEFPIDGDMAGTSAEFTLDLGLVQIPTDGVLSELLGTFKPKTVEKEEPTDEERVESRIPPIHGTITNGSLRYEKFVMQSNGFEVTTTGTINLVKREVDLLASVPLIGWKSMFADLTKIAPSFLTDVPLNVPFYLVVRGPIDNPTIKPDPKGAQRVSKEFFNNVGKALFDDLLKGVLNPNEKKKK